jgi:hypothetical protein
MPFFYYLCNKKPGRWHKNAWQPGSVIAENQRTLRYCPLPNRPRRE